jgi:hypothetical protein
MAVREPTTRLLGQTAFSAADCESALRGQTLPEHLGNRVVQLCLVSGIRQHVAFARSAEVAELCRMEGQEMFARARNARLIMSDEVPGLELMRDKASYPYCIWYPDIASEDTYRKVAAAFPDMRYQVGRACAVAGYAQLYRELDLLPDPCIAEEAREAGHASAGSRQIFEQIMTAPVRYGVMNDYDLTVELDRPKPGAFLNADTAVRATLKGRRRFVDDFVPWRYFNITEDWGIGQETVELEPAKLTDEEVALLESPLPVNLPTMQKDLLILASAYEGNLDRYARLRRPGRSVEYELHCLVPGIYRSTAMALWLGRKPDIMEVVAAAWDEDEVTALRRAIHARHVMNNDIHRLLDADPPVPDDELPYWIWYPTIPSPYTLCKLAEARPAMRPQCARACIAGGHRWAYTKIMDMPDANEGQVPLAADPFLIREAESGPDHDFFVPDMERRRQERGLKPQRVHHDRWKSSIPWRLGDTSSTALYGFLVDSGSCVVHEGQDWGMWEGLGAELGRVRLHLSSPPEERARAMREGGFVSLEDHRLRLG